MNEGVTCVGIIMDGNRRWATKQGLPKLAGHTAGAATLKKAIRFIRERGVKHLVVYAFSNENWLREASEVMYLGEILLNFLKDEVDQLKEGGIRIRFVGEREKFGEKIRAAMQDAEVRTRESDSMTLWCAVSYGGRAEIVAAAKKAAAEGEVTEASLAANLWTAEMPDPDLIIRTSGEKRLSGFLPWQTVYSELFFTDTLWPDFSEAEFDAILAEYATRERRHGK